MDLYLVKNKLPYKSYQRILIMAMDNRPNYLDCEFYVIILHFYTRV